MKTVNKYLIISGRGAVRIVGRKPKPSTLRYDEMAFPLNVHIPEGWGQLYGDVPIDLTLPEPGEAAVTITGLADIAGVL